MHFPFRKKILMKGKMKSKLTLTLLTGPPCRVVPSRPRMLSVIERWNFAAYLSPSDTTKSIAIILCEPDMLTIPSNGYQYRALFKGWKGGVPPPPRHSCPPEPHIILSSFHPLIFSIPQIRPP